MSRPDDASVDAAALARLRDASPGAESMARFASATVSDADVAEDVLADVAAYTGGAVWRLDWLPREPRPGTRHVAVESRAFDDDAHAFRLGSARARPPRRRRARRDRPDLGAAPRRSLLGAGRRERARPRDRERARVQAPT